MLEASLRAAPFTPLIPDGNKSNNRNTSQNWVKGHKRLHNYMIMVSVIVICSVIWYRLFHIDSHLIIHMTYYCCKSRFILYRYIHVLDIQCKVLEKYWPLFPWCSGPLKIWDSIKPNMYNHVLPNSGGFCHASTLCGTQVCKLSILWEP